MDEPSPSDDSSVDDGTPPTPTPTPAITGVVDREPLEAFVDARIDARLDDLQQPSPGNGSDDSDEEGDRDETDGADPDFEETIEREYLAADVQTLLDDVERLFEQLDPEEFATLIDRLDSGLTTFESRMGLKATIGPDVPDDAHAHSTPGWGLVFECDDPLHLTECTVVSNQPGETVVELHEYDGDSQGLVDSTRLTLPVTGEQDVNIDITVPEGGTYLLTRDYQALKDGELVDDERVALWRTHDDWDGWGTLENGLMTLISSAHPDFGSEPELWYYFFSLDVSATTTPDAED